jgi:hypothetical protein
LANKLAVSLLLLAFVVPQQAAWGWGSDGHMYVNRVAVEKLPQDVPAFLRGAVAELTYLGPEPDRWRDNSDPSLKSAQEPDQKGGQIDGHIAYIAYPNGAEVSFSYSGGVNNVEESCAGVIPTITETLNPGPGIPTSTRTFVNNRGAITQSNFTVTETNSVDNSTVVHSYLSTCDINAPGSINGCSGWPFTGQFLTQTQVFQGGTLLSTQILCYNTASPAPANCPNGVTPPSYPVTRLLTYYSHDGMPATTTNRVLDTFDSYGNHLIHGVYDWGRWGGAELWDC